MSLEALKEDLNQRDKDIKELYSYLVKLDESNELSYILKANLFVMLYNKVEFFLESLFSQSMMKSTIKTLIFLNLNHMFNILLLIIFSPRIAVKIKNIIL